MTNQTIDGVTRELLALLDAHREALKLLGLPLGDRLERASEELRALLDAPVIEREPVAVVVEGRGVGYSLEGVILATAVINGTVKPGDKLYAEEHKPPTCHWACTGCNICGKAGHGDSWF